MFYFYRIIPYIDCSLSTFPKCSFFIFYFVLICIFIILSNSYRQTKSTNITYSKPKLPESPRHSFRLQRDHLQGEEKSPNVFSFAYIGPVRFNYLCWLYIFHNLFPYNFLLVLFLLVQIFRIVVFTGFVEIKSCNMYSKLIGFIFQNLESLNDSSALRQFR